jgi:hypothetical protein
MRYLIINPDGSVKGTQTLTDAMADRFEAKGYQVIPAVEVATVKVTFGARR